MRKHPAGPHQLPSYCRSGRFREVNLEVTNSCNFRCWFCPRHAMTRPQGLMPVARFQDLALALDRLGILQEMAIAGIGEPTLHPDLPDMIAYVKDNTSLAVVLTTNGSRLGEPGYANRLLASRPDKITVSLRLTTEQGISEGTPATLSWEPYAASVLELVELALAGDNATEIEIALFKPTLYARHVLGFVEKRYLDRRRLDSFIASLASILGLDLPRYSDLVSTLPRQLSNVDRMPLGHGVSLRLDGLSGWTTAGEKFGPGGRCHPAAFGSCLGMTTHFAIYQDGDVSTCCADFNVRNKLGNAFTEEISDILWSARAECWATALHHRRMPTSFCRQCRGGATHLEKWANIIGTLLYVRESA